MKKLAKTKLVVLNLLLAFLFTACKDDDNNPVNPINAGSDACQLVKEVYVGDDDYIEFEYNAQGYLTKTMEKETGSNTPNYYTVFTYNANNQLIKVEDFDNGQKDGYYTFEYTNDLITTVKEFDENGAQDIDDTRTYKYDSNKRMIEEKHTDGYTYKYSYDSKGNIAKMEEVNQNVVVYQEVYENYDDKTSPYAALKGYPLFLLATSKNNPGKVTTSYDRNGDGIVQPSELEISTFTYKYNSQGYTTEVKEVDGSDIETTTFNYNCK